MIKMTLTAALRAKQSERQKEIFWNSSVLCNPEIITIQSFHAVYSQSIWRRRFWFHKVHRNVIPSRPCPLTISWHIFKWLRWLSSLNTDCLCSYGKAVTVIDYVRLLLGIGKKSWIGAPTTTLCVGKKCNDYVTINQISRPLFSYRLSLSNSVFTLSFWLITLYP